MHFERLHTTSYLHFIETIFRDVRPKKPVRPDPALRPKTRIRGMASDLLKVAHFSHPRAFGVPVEEDTIGISSKHLTSVNKSPCRLSGTGAKYCDQRVCMSVYLLASQKPHVQASRNFLRVTFGRG